MSWEYQDYCNANYGPEDELPDDYGPGVPEREQSNPGTACDGKKLPSGNMALPKIEMTSAQIALAEKNGRVRTVEGKRVIDLPNHGAVEIIEVTPSPPVSR